MPPRRNCSLRSGAAGDPIKRVRPHLDDKILTAWNGLMISAFAKGAQVLDEPRYLEAAQRAATFILTRMYNAESGVLLRRYRDGEAAIAGFLDDYAFFIGALLDLYEADFDQRHMEMRRRWRTRCGELFEDKPTARFSARLRATATWCCA